MGDIRLREDTLKAKCTYKYILTGINKEEANGDPRGSGLRRSMWTIIDQDRPVHATFQEVVEI
jgi:hypothetical protein